MQKLKKVAAVAAMVGGLGLIGTGVASAHGGHDYDDPFKIDNLQVVKCHQDYDAGAAHTHTGPTVSGDEHSNEGNFCTVIGHIR